MKQLTILLFLTLSTAVFAADEQKQTVKKEAWKKIQQVANSAIQEAAKSKVVIFKAPAFHIDDSINLNTPKINLLALNLNKN